MNTFPESSQICMNIARFRHPCVAQTEESMIMARVPSFTGTNMQLQNECLHALSIHST